MGEKILAEKFSEFPTGNLCNAHSKVRAMNAAIRSLFPGVKLVGPAKTAITLPGQNAAIHRTLINAKPGDVLVVDGGGSRDFGPFGDILASACQQRGIAGLVIDSTVRDLAGIQELGFPVFCLGTNPSATVKTDPGKIDVPVNCGEVDVSPGDLIVGDEDGVVVIPKELIRKVLTSAAAIVAREKEILKEIAEGKTTCEIFKIPL